MGDKFTFEIQSSPAGFTGRCLEVPSASGLAETLEKCAENLGEAVEMALRENEPFLTIKTFKLEVDGLGLAAIRIVQSPEGFAIGCTDLPGCWSQGETEQEAIANIRAAIKDYREVAQQMAKEREAQLIKAA
jgi:predicted RNase H-like HicB family nuclease